MERANNSMPKKTHKELFNEQYESSLAEQGFDERLRGVHTSRTMMLAELKLVLSSLPSDVNPIAVQKAILEENALGKATRSGKVNSANKLINLYSFEMDRPLYAAFDTFWRESSTSRPVLAVLMAQCRDMVLRASSKIILETPIGSVVTTNRLYENLLLGFPSKYTEITLQSTTRNITSTWRRSGHITTPRRAYPPRLSWKERANIVPSGFHRG